MKNDQYININEIARIKGLTTTRSIRQAIQKGKYIARKIKVNGGESYEILYSSLEIDLQVKILQSENSSTALVPINNIVPAFISDNAKQIANARTNIVHYFEQLRANYKTKKETEVAFLDLYNSGLLLKESGCEQRVKAVANPFNASIQDRNYIIMSDDPIEIKLDNLDVREKLLELSQKTKNLRPLMKSVAGILASATEDNFKEEGRPDKWVDLSEVTKKLRTEKGKWPGQILQVEGMLSQSISTAYDNDSAIIGSNLDYAAIHQLGGQAGKNLKVTIPARPYLKLTDDDYDEILHETEKYLTE